MIEVRTREGTITVVPRGELDIATAPALRHAMDAAVCGDWHVISIDLSEVTFLDVVGSHPVRAAAETCRITSKQFRLINPRPAVARALGWLDLAEYVRPVDELRLPASPAETTGSPSVPAQPGSEVSV